MAKSINVLVAGAGSRAKKMNFCANKIRQDNPESNINFTGVVDIDPKVALEYAEFYGLSENNVFFDVSEALASREKCDFDAIYIATPDFTHSSMAMNALDWGYHVLLEKPMGTNEEDCKYLLKAHELSEKRLTLCHVLKHSEFFRTLKEIADSGELGVHYGTDIQENVHPVHFSHAYSRGNWGTEAKGGSSVIAAKSVHDMDIIVSHAESDIDSVSSIASQNMFLPENAPECSAERCVDCKVPKCPFNAVDLYIKDKVVFKDESTGKDRVGWPSEHASTSLDDEERMKALREGPYGVCAWKTGTDMMDHQDVSIEFENGFQSQFRLRLGVPETRKIHMYFEGGYVEADMASSKIVKVKYTQGIHSGEQEVVQLRKTDGHAGGDFGLIADFERLIRDPSLVDINSLEKSVDSHLIAFAAEKSRKDSIPGEPVYF